MEPGDGIGNSELKVGVTDTEIQCLQLVQDTHPNANGATFGTGSSHVGSCYAEFGMTGSITRTTWVTCQFSGTTKYPKVSQHLYAQHTCESGLVIMELACFVL